ncbi:MAG: redoxin domain-containing protein [Pseudomonadota bacterium]
MISRRHFLQASTAGIASASLLTPAVVLAQHSGITGQIAPELDASYWIGADGKQTTAFSVAANKGKWVLLKCFQNWCPGCHSLGFPSLQKLVDTFGDNEQVKFAAIQTTFEGFSTNNQDALLKNQQRYGLAIPFGHDQGDPNAAHGDVRRRPNTMVAYRTGGTPWFIVIHPAGRVVYNHFNVDTDRLIEILKKETGQA